MAKVVRANWKAVAEAFMESHHSITTHPQILPFLADANSQYDLLNDYVSRHFSASGVPSPFIADKNLSDSDIIRAMAAGGGGTRRRGFGENNTDVPSSTTARAFAAESGAAEPFCRGWLGLLAVLRRRDDRCPSL